MNSIKRFTLASALALLATQTQALNILLTNDDGFDHPWMRAVHSSLVEAGHEVTIVAPAVNQSGQSAALTLSEVAIENPEPGIFSVNATPATSVILAVREVLDERPDLIISGINDAPNIGVLSSFSGTVGAVVAGLHMLGEPIPGIAISAAPIDPESNTKSPQNVAHARDIAAFLQGFVADLERTRPEGEALLPSGIALNINYPGIRPEDVQGPGLYQHGKNVSHILRMSERGLLWQDEPESENEKWDTVGLSRGYITIVPIDGDYTARNWSTVISDRLTDRLQNLPNLEH